MTCQLARGYFRPVTAKHLRYFLGWPVLATGLFASFHAAADDSDPTAIEQRLKALETTAERQALVREPAAQARKALKRVLDARAAGDAAHAVELAALANDWVDFAAHVVRASELEKEVAKEQTNLSELDQKRRRTETLLEATVAQRERTREELKRSATTPTLPAAPATAGQARSPTRPATKSVSPPARQANTDPATAPKQPSAGPRGK